MSSARSLLGLLHGAGVTGDALLLAGTALLGSFTTFSTWMVQTERLAGRGRGRPGGRERAGSLALGLAAFALGWAIGAAALASSPVARRPPYWVRVAPQQTDQTSASACNAAVLRRRGRATRRRGRPPDHTARRARRSGARERQQRRARHRAARRRRERIGAPAASPRRRSRGAGAGLTHPATPRVAGARASPTHDPARREPRPPRLPHAPPELPQRAHTTSRRPRPAAPTAPAPPTRARLIRSRPRAP